MFGDMGTQCPPVAATPPRMQKTEHGKPAALIRRLPTLSAKRPLDTRSKFDTQHGKHSRHTDCQN